MAANLIRIRSVRAMRIGEPWLFRASYANLALHARMNFAEVRIGPRVIKGGFERGTRAIEIAVEGAVGTASGSLRHSGDPLLLREAGRDRMNYVVFVRPGDAVAGPHFYDLRTESDPFDGDRRPFGRSLIRSLRASSPTGGRAGGEEHRDYRYRKFVEHTIDSFRKPQTYWLVQPFQI